MSARGDNDVAVIGLGRFGCQLAGTLTRLGHPVLAIDRDLDRVQRWSSSLERVVQADATEEGALRQLGVADFRRAVVALGTAVDSSVLTVLALTEMGMPQIWARANSQKHAKILASVGAHHVVFPEAETGERVAHLIVSRMLDFIEFGDDLAIAKVPVPPPLVGKPLRELALTERYGVRVVGTKVAGERFRYAEPDIVLGADGVLIVEGSITDVQRFAALG